MKILIEIFFSHLGKKRERKKEKRKKEKKELEHTRCPK